MTLTLYDARLYNPRLPNNVINIIIRYRAKRSIFRTIFSFILVISFIVIDYTLVQDNSTHLITFPRMTAKFACTTPSVQCTYTQIVKTIKILT